jgi:Sodium:sulfate symporter transmembrane region
MGPWNLAEQKALGWLLLAIILWSTDFLHHLHPAVIALGIGLLLAIPKVGLLDAKAVKSMNFLLIIFLAGVISMSNVLIETKALNVLTDSLVGWMAPLLSNALHAAITLYWGGFLYHFFIPTDPAMVSTALPLLLELAKAQGSKPMALGMIWAFAAGGKLFVYQNSTLIMGYAYGFFGGRDVLKIGAILTLIEGLVLMALVPLYWPLLGLPWRSESDASTRARGAYLEQPPALRHAWATGAHITEAWAPIEPQRGQFDRNAIEQQPIVIETVNASQPFGILPGLHGTPADPVLSAWGWVPHIDASMNDSPSYQTLGKNMTTLELSGKHPRTHSQSHDVGGVADS